MTNAPTSRKIPADEHNAVQLRKLYEELTRVAREAIERNFGGFEMSATVQDGRIVRMDVVSRTTIKPA